jgi:3-phosphoshikimate 1-carboxyvinyltransferase
MRPLAAALAFAGGHYRLDGVARMRERPIGDLVDALREAGARVDYLGQPGFPPLQILPAQEAPDGRASLRVRGAVSSQFLTGLLIAAPGIAGAQGLRIEVQGELISRPYVELTLGMMRQFGARVSAQGNAFEVAPGAYAAPGEYPVEGDASGASYFLALGALAGGPVRVQGVGANSLQGDVAFARVLARMGARVQTGPDWIEAAAPADARLQGIEFDATEIPDAAMTLAVLAAFAQGPTRLTGIGSWRVKETDRIAAMATELAKLGAQVQSGPDWLAVTPPARLQAAQIATYDDHRMAMCFALAACGGAPIDILEPACVSKTYPDFFVELERLRQPA